MVDLTEELLRGLFGVRDAIGSSSSLRSIQLGSPVDDDTLAYVTVLVDRTEDVLRLCLGDRSKFGSTSSLRSNLAPPPRLTLGFRMIRGGGGARQQPELCGTGNYLSSGFPEELPLSVRASCSCGRCDYPMTRDTNHETSNGLQSVTERLLRVISNSHVPMTHAPDGDSCHENESVTGHNPQVRLSFAHAS